MVPRRKNQKITSSNHLKVAEAVYQFVLIFVDVFFYPVYFHDSFFATLSIIRVHLLCFGSVLKLVSQVR